MYLIIGVVIVCLVFGWSTVFTEGSLKVKDLTVKSLSAYLFLLYFTYVFLNYGVVILLSRLGLL